MKVLAIVLCFLTLLEPVCAEPLGRDALQVALEQCIVTHAPTRRTTVTLKVVDLETGEVVFDRGGERLLTPASNLKIYTSACALELFGPEHRFQTTVEAHGSLEQGVLTGKLSLVGGGDAMLSHSQLGELADKVVDRWKLRRVVGEVRADNARYSSPLKGPGWMWDDDPDYYNMPVTPLMLDFNVLALELSQDDQGNLAAEKKLASDYPPIEVVEPSLLPGGRLFWRNPATDAILLARHGNLQKYLDSLEEDEVPRLTPCRPGAWIESVFQTMLRDRGVTIEEKPLRFVKPPERIGEVIYEGTPLAETLRHFNHASENAVGEVLLHEIAIAQGIQKPKWSDGAKAITEWLTDKAGLEPGSFRLVDGSGLTRYNLITADSSVKLLTYMRGHKHYKTFFAALPEYELELEKIDWPEGSLEDSNRKRVRAKPGGMSGVSTISGYLETLDGRQLVISLLANGYIGSSKPVLALRHKVWNTLVQYRAE